MAARARHPGPGQPIITREMARELRGMFHGARAEERRQGVARRRSGVWKSDIIPIYV